MSEREKVVIKLGSPSSADGRGVRRQRLYGYAREVAEQKALGRDVIIVASGSIAVAKAILPANVLASPKVTQQMLATRGNPHLMKAWQDALSRYGIQSGELLLTHHETEDKGERKKLVDGIHDHVEAGWVPVINENDGMSDIEIAALAFGGDNDGLAAQVAKKIKAKHLCLLTEEAGVIDREGNVLRWLTPHATVWAEQFDRGSTKLGRGGIKSKLRAGASAARAGVIVHIAHATARVEDVLTAECGTQISTRMQFPKAVESLPK